MNQRPLSQTTAEHDRVAEIQRLAAQGVTALPSLIQRLDEPSWSVRREIVAVVASFNAAAVVPLCAALRAERGNEARIAALVDALVVVDADVLAEVAKLARCGDAALAADAAQIFGRRRSRRAVSVLQELVVGGDDNAAVAAIEALGRIGGAAAVDTLVTAVNTGSFFRVFPAIDVLGRSGDPRAVAPLITLLADPMYAPEAARALGKTGQLVAVPALASLVASPVESVTRVAATALAEIGGKHREQYGTDDAVDEALRGAIDASAVVKLRRALQTADAAERLAIIAILGAVGGGPADRSNPSEHSGAVESLRALLADPEVAEAAAKALKKVGRDAERSVRDTLRDGDSAERRVLLPIITRVSVVDELRLCLVDPDAEVRSRACAALARVGARSSVPALFGMLTDEKPGVVQAAVAAIQSLGSDDTKELALRAAQNRRPAVRRTALRILGYFGTVEALPIFLAALEDDDAGAREAALLGLALVDDPRALDALLRAVGSEITKTRAVAARALGQSGKREDVRVATALRAALSDPDAWVRYFACQALGRLVVDDAVDDVTRLLGDDAGQVCVAAVEALARMSAPVAFDSLRIAVEGDDPDVTRAALLGLASKPDALPVLLRAANDPQAATRLVAVCALADVGGPQSLAPLAAAARDSDENVRAAALGLLAEHAGGESTAPLVGLLRDLTMDVAREGVGGVAGRALERVVAALARPAPGRVAGLVAALAAADDALATQLVGCLARSRTVESAAGLVLALRCESVAARKAAAGALGNLRTLSALSALQTAAISDADPGVRGVARVLVGQ